MNWFDYLWDKVFPVGKVTPTLETRQYNVGEIFYLITYKNAKDKVVTYLGSMRGHTSSSLSVSSADEGFAFIDEITITTAEDKLKEWLYESKRLGAYLLDNKYIPRERVLEISLTHKEYLVEETSGKF